ncbi:ABC transporter permease, partial [Lactobacillus sp. XV13L]|nr:ABC transporter permease [Lactobacillus sp. XV13L]
PGFRGFTTLSSRIDAIGNVFPVFFFLLGILITFTTITRMVEENRQEIGTLKTLGYRNWEIAQKYLLYALIITAIALVLGIEVGTKALPPIVYRILKSNYVFNNYPSYYWLEPIITASLLALGATFGATIYILLTDLHQKPIVLLLPKAPKVGRRI